MGDRDLNRRVSKTDAEQVGRPSVSASGSSSVREYVQQRIGLSRAVMEPVSYLVQDPYQKTDEMKEKQRGHTCYCYVPSLEHYSLWDDNYPESPMRAAVIDTRLKELSDRLKILCTSDVIGIEDMELLTLVHDRDYVEYLEQICTDADKSTAEQYDSVYFSGKKSYEGAVEAAKKTASLAMGIATGKFQNGFANVRPPGHHASAQTPNGYCLLNNVAIAAKYLLQENLAERILIVDVDVHHGQGTQRTFYDSDQVLYISIHRYEYGKFWPHLRESNFNFVGNNKGLGYNVNIPLNETGLNDTDYMAILLNVILPVAYEFCPSIIIVSGGYDACIGCPEGEMNVTPAFYAHMISLLSGLAEGKILVVLEGGYFLPSLSEGAFQTVRALLNLPCPPLEHNKRINPSVIDTINNVKVALTPYWKCFSDAERLCVVENPLDYDRYREHCAEVKYHGTEVLPPFSVKDNYPQNSDRQKKIYTAKVEYLKELYKTPMDDIRIGIAFNNIAYLHSPNELDRAQEIPRRLDMIRKKFEEFHIMSSHVLEYPIRSDDDLLKTAREYAEDCINLTHSFNYLKLLKGDGPDPKPDLYFTKDSFSVCLESCALIIQLVMDVKSESISHAFAAVRPPGHHAKRDQGGGFCLINNVAVASSFALGIGFDKILIVDFDVHHGDGTQDLTYEKENILYISMHRYDNANFFPKDDKGNYRYVGEQAAAGFNVNVAFEDTKLEDVDYLHAWMKLVVPIAYSFKPDLIFVSAGFDAGISDPLGGYKVHPETFGHMVNMLRAIAPLIVCLEGGYNLETTSLGAVNCVRALIGDPLPTVKIGNIQPQSVQAVEKTIKALKPYWPMLEVNKALDPTFRFEGPIN